MSNEGEGQGRIHSENPFADPIEARAPARRLRGRLPAPVTLWTAGSLESATGLTVSSMLVAEGEPSLVVGLVSPMTDLFEVIQETGKWVVHVLEQGDRELSERFAGLRPSPGGLFTGLVVEASEHGPVLASLRSRAYCSLTGWDQAGYHQLLRGHIDSIELAEEGDPLVHLRGRYRQLGGPENER